MRLSNRRFAFFQLQPRHAPLLLDLVNRLFPSLKTGEWATPLGLIHSLSASDRVLMCATTDNDNQPRMAGLVWVECLRPVSYFHIMLDKPYMRQASNLLERAANAMFDCSSELQVLKVYGLKTDGLYRWFQRQEIGQLYWIKNGEFDDRRGVLTDTWEFVIPRPEIRYAGEKPQNQEPCCGKEEIHTETASRPKGTGPGQCQHTVWFRRLFKRAVQYFLGHRFGV